jgi:hypothetical protein
MGVATAAGSTLSIGTTATVAATDTYAAIGNITGLPEYGRVYSEIKFSPLSSRAVQKFKGSYDDGSVSVPMGKDLSDAGQAALQTALDSDDDYNFKVVDNDDVVATSATVTMATGTPGVITDTAHGFAVDTAVKFTTTGGLLTGLTAGTTYYVKEVLSDNTYSLAATKGDTAIDLSSTQSGVHTRTTVPAGSYQYFKAKVMSYTTTRDNADSVIMATALLSIKSGSISEQVHLP